MSLPERLVTLKMSEQDVFGKGCLPRGSEANDYGVQDVRHSSPFPPGLTLLPLLLLQDLLPNVDAGIFLDNDLIALRDPAILWDRWK